MKCNHNPPITDNFPINLAQVLVPGNLPFVPTYEIPEELNLQIGDLVEVPLGKKNVIGVVWQSVEESPKIANIKTIIRKIGEYHFDELFCRYLDWMAKYTYNPIGNILKLALPFQTLETFEKQEPLFGLGDWQGVRMTPGRQNIQQLLQNDAVFSKAEIVSQAEVSLSQVNTLIKSGAIKQVSSRLIKEHVDYTPHFKLPELSSEQQSAKSAIMNYSNEEKLRPIVLDGVTGAGKTEVYLSVIEEIFQDDPEAQILILLPEITLTNQMQARYEERLGVSPICWHSAITKTRKQKYWQHCHDGSARVVIGARSALFLPFKNLKLIIIDEEHDSSYKQEEGVIYHARDMAVARAARQRIPIILASATPAIETLYNVEQGKYHLVHLKNRFGSASMPEIGIIDLNKNKKDRKENLSEPLVAALKENLAQGKQSLLFLNKRGFASYIFCAECGYYFECNHCSSKMVWHSKHQKLLCHYCGYTQNVETDCPGCEATESYVMLGSGVEKIRQEIHEKIPKARTLEMTSDTLSSTKKAQELFSQIADGQADIIVGTQVMAKGHHFPNLTLVGIVDADMGFIGADLRANERSYQLLHQVSGRAGRATDKGKVLVQTYLPEHPVLKAIQDDSRSDFINLELLGRERLHMPPFGKLAAIIIKGSKEYVVAQIAKSIALRAPSPGEAVSVLGPIPAPMAKIRNQYRYRLLVKTSLKVNIQKLVVHLVAPIKVPHSVSIKVDINPMSFF